MKSTRRQWMKAAPVAVVSAVAAAQVRAARANELPSEPLLQFTSMAGNESNLTINGITGDYDPWKVYDADGILTLDGHLVIAVIGLIFEDGRPNDEHKFRAIFSCTSENGDVVNTSTQDFPTGPKGNCLIKSKITIPDYCFAPIIFVGPGAGQNRDTPVPDGTGVWFASTGIKD